MSDVIKLGFDPIPVLGSGRPELPKVPDLPSPKPIASKPAEPKPATPPAPEPAAVPSPTASPLWSLFEPNRAKGVIAAGLISLLGGAATVRFLWPPKTPTATAEAKVERDSPAPLPVAAPLLEPTPLPKVEPVNLTPIVPATGGTTIELPKLDLPAIAPVPAAVPTPAPTPNPTPAPAPTPSLVTLPSQMSPALPSIALPELVRTGANEPEKPLDIKLPELVPSSGTAPPIPSPVTLPVPTPAPAVAAPMPALLPLPDVKGPVAAPAKVELPKVELPSAIKIEPPAVASTPVPTAKVPEIGLPSLTETPAPKIEPSLPPVEIKTDVKPLPSTEFPVISSVPVTATPASAVRPAPAGPVAIAATPPRTDYDIDLHYVRAGDSWTAISKQYFGDERYADAIKGFNRNASLAGAQRVEVPPIHVLRKNFASQIGRPVERSGDWGTITPSGATEPKRAITGSGYKLYTVPVGGRTLKEIAADAYGDEGRWGMVWDTNPKLVPDKVVPEGTKIYLTSQAKIGE